LNSNPLAKNWVGILCGLAGLFILASGAMGTEPINSDFHAVPPFMSVSVKPNILLVVDSSGSMNEFAYQEVSGCRSYSSSCACDVQSWSGYQEGTEYYGLFDPDLCYTYSKTSHYFSAVGPTDDATSTPDVVERAAAVPGQWSDGRSCFSGNWLNWLTTRRTDAAKKVLTGGKLFPGKTDVLMGTVGPDATSLDRDQRKVYNDRLATPEQPGKAVYYTPLHEPMYIYFFAEAIPGTATYGVVFNLIKSRPCATAHRVDTTVYDNQAATYGGETSATCPSCDYNGFFVAVQADTPPSGIVQNFGNSVDDNGQDTDPATDDSKVRLGYMHYNYDDGGKLYNPVDDAGQDNSHFEDIVETINSLRCEGWTPTDEAVYEATRYFQQTSPRYSQDSSTWYQDPYIFRMPDPNDPSQMVDQVVPCSKSFIILITDGEPNYNEDIGSWADRAFVGDGWFNYSGQYSYYLDDMAYTTHTQDIRTDLDGNQTLTLYTVFAFDNSERAKNYLKRAARAGAFNDLNGDGQPFSDEPGYTGTNDWAENFYTGSCGTRDVNGACLAHASCKEWDRDCDGHPDTYFEAQNGGELAEGLLKAITDILRRTASGSSVAVLSTSGYSEGALFQAFFKPTEITTMGADVAETTWVGYLHGLWVDRDGNLREDNGDRKLIEADDPVITFSFDPDLGTRATRDLDGDGTPEEENIPLRDIRSLWEAGKMLALRDPASRTLFTSVGVPPLIGSPPPRVDLITGNAASLQYELRAPTVTAAEEIIRFARGEDLGTPGTRSRATYIDTNGDTVPDTVGTWRLGDIVYSTPKPVARPMENFDDPHMYGDKFSYVRKTYRRFEQQYQDRTTTVYVGANDGMLHAFHAGLYMAGDDATSGETAEHGRYVPAGTEIGEELWAYVPNSLLPHLRWLKDDTYVHVYYVDLEPKVTDAQIFVGEDDAPTGKHPYGWGTVLIGSLRLGGAAYATDDWNMDGVSGDAWTSPGSCHFAIDITVPDDPVLLWEFTHPGLGFTTTYPAIVRTGEPTGPGNWYVLVGSGPTDFQGDSSQSAKLFVLDLKTGVLQKVLELASSGSGFVGGVSTTDGPPGTPDWDFNVSAAYVAESYKTGADWQGRMHRVFIGVRESGILPPASWSHSTLVSNRSGQPMVTYPNLVDAWGKVMALFGTGRFFDRTTDTLISTQSLYGVKDNTLLAGDPAEGLAASTLIDATGVTLRYDPTATDDAQDLIVGGSSFGTLWADVTAAMEHESGWRNDLQSGERVLEPANAVGGFQIDSAVVLYSAYRPDADICSFGGISSLYALNYGTGTAAPGAKHWGVFNPDAPTSVTLLETSQDLGAGRSSQPRVHTRGNKVFVQLSTGAIEEIFLRVDDYTQAVLWYE